jgi:hypothetical protein
MTFLRLTSCWNQVAGFPAAPQGNVTVASDEYVINGRVRRNAANRQQLGEAGRA